MFIIATTNDTSKNDGKNIFSEKRNCVQEKCETADWAQKFWSKIRVFVPPALFLPTRFRLHAQRDECYVHIMTQSEAALVVQKCWYQPAIFRRAGMSKSVKKCVTRMRKEQKNGRSRRHASSFALSSGIRSVHKALR